MKSEKKKHLLSDIFTVIMFIAALLAIIRLWPILLLLLIGLIAYALWTLFHVAKQPVKTESAPPPMLPEPVSEQSMLTTAFGLLQRQITEQVVARFPNARWVWSMPDAFSQFAAGRPLVIMLNGAGGYRKAAVQVSNLQFVGLIFGATPNSAPNPEQPGGNPSGQEEPSPEPEEVDYGLIAFEWTEANLQRLNALSNEAVAAGEDGFRIPAEELPHGDSWPVLCTELVRNGFSAAEPLANGIQVKIKTE